METKLPKPKKLTLRRKSDGATKFPRLVNEQTAGVAVHLLEVAALTRQIICRQNEATDLYRSLVREAALAVGAGATEAKVRQEIIQAGWTASRASEVLKVASLPEPDLRQYLEDGMSWRLALATARLSPLLRDSWDPIHAGLFADDLPRPAPMLRDLPPSENGGIGYLSIDPVTGNNMRVNADGSRYQPPAPAVVADGVTPSLDSSLLLPFGQAEAGTLILDGKPAPAPP